MFCPKKTYVKQLENECVICYDICVEIVSCCKHPIHSTCLQKYWKYSRKNNLCPYCRQDIDKKLNSSKFRKDLKKNFLKFKNAITFQRIHHWIR